MKLKNLTSVALVACLSIFLLTACANSEKAELLSEENFQSTVVENFADLAQNTYQTACISYNLEDKTITKIYEPDRANRQIKISSGQLSPNADKILLGLNPALGDSTKNDAYQYAILDLAGNHLAKYSAKFASYTGDKEDAVSAISAIGYADTGCWLNNETIANLGANTIVDKDQNIQRVAIPNKQQFAGFAVSANQENPILFHFDPANKGSGIFYSSYEPQGKLIATKNLGIKQNLSLVTGEVKQNLLVVNSQLSLPPTTSFINLTDDSIISNPVNFFTYALDSKGAYFAGIPLQIKNAKNVHEDADGDWLVVYNHLGEKIKGWKNPQTKNINELLTQVFWSTDSSTVYVLESDLKTKNTYIWQCSLEGGAKPKQVLTMPGHNQFVGLDSSNNLYLLVNP